ncbi:MAG: HesA/MoeB/ThiF family protein [Candidatus Thermoplasmatota archaeon]
MTDRHARHVRLDGIGTSGVERIRSGRVLIVGLGGLGCPAAQALAAAGVGTIGLCDPDRVEASNLARQPLFAPADVGRPKVKAVQQVLSRQNPDVNFGSYWFAFNSSHADLVSSFDVVLDCTDDLAAKLALADACRAAHIPLVHGAAAGWEGIVTVLHPPEGPCYRCIWPKPEAGASCSDVGVFAPLVATLGAIQAGEALKLLAGAGGTLLGKLLLWDARTSTATTVELTKRPGCACSMKQPLACPAPWATPPAPDVDVVEFAKRQGEFTLLDVREPDELEMGAIAGVINIPLNDLSVRMGELPQGKTVVCICAVGGRSARATTILNEHGIAALNLRGGMRAWMMARLPVHSP